MNALTQTIKMTNINEVAILVLVIAPFVALCQIEAWHCFCDVWLRKALRAEDNAFTSYQRLRA
jgi:hypothetical protein